LATTTEGGKKRKLKLKKRNLQGRGKEGGERRTAKRKRRCVLGQGANEIGTLEKRRPLCSRRKDQRKKERRDEKTTGKEGKLKRQKEERSATESRGLACHKQRLGGQSNRQNHLKPVSLSASEEKIACALFILVPRNVAFTAHPIPSRLSWEIENRPNARCCLLKT